MPGTGYMDKTILMLRKIYDEKYTGNRLTGKYIQTGTDQILLGREMLFQNGCSMLLPRYMKDMNDSMIMHKYRHLEKPEIIKTDQMGDATFTFSRLPVCGFPKCQDTVSEQLKDIQNNMKRVWKQYVFYDFGEVRSETTVTAWMDFKAQCLNGSLYCLLFIFNMGIQPILGNFHCSFDKYDSWKPTILKLLETIQTDGILNREVKDERLSD